MRGSFYRFVIIAVSLLVLAISTVLAGSSGGVAAGAGSIWNTGNMCASIAGRGVGSSSWLDFFTGGGSYMARTQCMVTATGETDWFWVWTLILLNAMIIVGYVRIFVFWRSAYKQEQVEDRDTKLMDLAWIFLFCACCGYVSSILLFFWPGYRFLALMLCPLAYFTWRFGWNLDSFRIALSAKRLERELNENLVLKNEVLRTEVERATCDLRAAKAEAELANQAKSDFLARVAHELRTPMTAMIGFLEIAMEEEERDDCQEHLFTIRRNSNHLVNLINDILDVSKIEAGQLTVEECPCSIDRIVAEVVGLLTNKAELVGTEIIARVDDDVPTEVVTDPMRVRQLIMNLIGNAIKFTRDGEVRIDVASTKDQSGRVDGLRIEVRDTGMGMTEEQQRVVFEKFSQASDDVARRFGGTGLGLTISREIALALGGDLTVESELGKGSSFVCTIRARASDEASPCTMWAGDAPSGCDREEALRGRRILLVEDVADNIKMFEHFFAKIGVELDSAQSGVEGLEKIVIAASCDQAYDLVLMDISMPEMDGLACLRRVRERGIGVPIIMVSAYAFSDERERCMSAGASGYCTKPVDFDHLFRLCVTLIGGGGDRSAA